MLEHRLKIEVYFQAVNVHCVEEALLWKYDFVIEKIVHRHILDLVNFSLYVRMVGCYVRTYTPTSH